MFAAAQRSFADNPKLEKAGRSGCKNYLNLRQGWSYYAQFAVEYLVWNKKRDDPSSPY